MSAASGRRAAALAILALSAPVARAQQDGDPLQLETVTVVGRSAIGLGVADSATEGRIGAAQLAARPLLRAAEVLESVPGMTVTQHSGDGKANQYFLRGFNLDHGSDFASIVAGMPVNVVSHAHGQGYSDLNFLVPELVRSVRYHKGPYGAQDGDFAVAGTARIDYLTEVPRPFAEFAAGSFGFRRMLAVGQAPSAGSAKLLGALELGQTDGPWEEPERLRKANGLLHLSDGTSENGFRILAMAYSARWVATEQVPERAVTAGEIGRFGTLAPTDGGRTQRYSLSGDITRSDDGGSWAAAAYVLRYGLNLYSTPSGRLTGQHEQEDRRTTWGASASRDWDFGPEGLDSTVSVGLQIRGDSVPRVGLFETTDRQRTQVIRQDRVSETAVATFAEARTRWSPWLRSILGLRFDSIHGDVVPLGGAFNAGNGGSARGSQWSPKVSLAFGPFGRSEFFVNAGQGFHSNDMRGATARTNPADGTAVQPVPLFVRATSAELGVRTQPLPGWRSALSIWRTALASELVYIGDAGVTEPKGASRRKGVEWWNDFAPVDGVTVDADLSLSRAKFTESTGTGSQVPNAIPVSASMGLALDRNGPWTWGIRARYIGAYPLEESGTQKSSPLFTVNLKAGYRFASGWQASIEVLNVFDRRSNDIEYWGSACTRSEGSGCNNGQGFEGRLVHPMEPRAIRLSLRAAL